MSSLLPMKACFQCHKPTILCKNFAHIRTMKIIFKFFIRFDHLGLHFTYLLYLKFSVAVSSVVKNQMKMISIVKFFFHIDLNSNPVEIFHHFSVWKTQWIFHYVQCNVMKKYTMNRQTASRRKNFFFLIFIEKCNDYDFFHFQTNFNFHLVSFFHFRLLNSIFYL